MSYFWDSFKVKCGLCLTLKMCISKILQLEESLGNKVTVKLVTVFFDPLPF